MNNQNIKLTLRSLLKNRVVSFLNLIGLTVGITVYLLTFLFVLKERNVDKYIPHLDHIYVLTNQDDVAFSQGMVNHIKTAIPELNAVTYCCYDWSPQIFLKRNNSYKVRKMLTADSCFFRVFNFKPLWGNPEDALTATNKIVITRSLSEKIFGKENPVGKTVTYNATYLQGEELEVTAVIDDLPQSSSWDFEAVLSFQTNYHIGWYVNNLKRWGTQNYQAFTKINATVPGEMVNNKLANISLDAVPDGYKDDTRYGIFPFKKAYFDLPGLDVIKHGNRFTLSIIGIVGILILLLSCVNYINMVTAQREKRYKNIGIFKTMGSDRNRIFQMATTESALMLLTAIVFSFFTTLFLLPGFNLLTGSKFSIDQLFTADFLTMLLLAFGIMIFFTGIVPGFIFGNKPVTLLIRKDQSSGGKNLVRNSLLVFQFTVSIALIASILMINRQNSYVKKQDTGFTRENIVYANTNDILDDHIDAFKSEVKKITGINEFTFSESVLIKNNENWGIDMVNKGEKYNINFSKMSVAPNFFDFFGIKLREGNTFNGYSNKKKDFIFNQAAKDEFGIENIENARVAISSDPQQGCIIGIVDDYNFESFHVPIRPAAFMSSGDCDEVMYLKISTGNLASFHAIMKEVEKLWSRFSPDFPFEYQFLDQTYAAMYTKEAQFQKFLLYITLISLVLSCLGLIGLTFFVMERRTKEIGIRKVNGAKVSEILAMLNEDFVKWVAIAFVIATPVAWYVMNKWLESFAYKTTLSWWIFALAGLLALGIALLTVSWQSWKAATRNPIEALRYE